MKLLRLIVLFTIMAFTTKTKTLVKPLKTKKSPTHSIESPNLKLSKIKIRDLNLFLEVVGQKESSNRYHVVNRFGYMGRYQFSIKTLKGLGIKTSKNEFISNPKLQDSAMILLLKHNKNRLKGVIDRYEGKYIKGILITESGMLAAAHLAGPNRVKRFLRKGKDFQDGFGTKMTSYLDQFSGYYLNLK